MQSQIPPHARPMERASLKRKLESGRNIQMPAPRRIGKTWTINKLAEDMGNEGWLIVELDVQGISDPDEFSKQLCRKIQSKLPLQDSAWTSFKKRVENLASRDWNGKPLDALGSLSPADFLDALIAALSKQEKKAAILVDEIAYFVLELAEAKKKVAKNFFYELRRIQSEHKDVRWLYTGSIGLDAVAERYGLTGAFVDFQRFVLEPFTEEEAHSFICDAETQKTLTCPFCADKKALDYMFREIGWLAPYYLELVGNEVKPSGDKKENARQASKSDIEAALERLLKPDRKGDFAIWREHIDKNLPKSDKKIAVSILHALCQAPDGEEIDTLIASNDPQPSKKVKSVLDVLQNDGLVHKVGERFCFRSGLVRRYWKEYEAE
ncbi:AAA family ATPase [Cohaesibacter gelatinilyticus]|uniref:Predicted ATPase, AAA+ ATPase superfamily n=1 Tax=Cohaesibacter gelatinilyticus TaxID=372072 RepID=A0A285PBR6_9HYPH|nr:AAA family ATPase [Cohaesibacter gelatinilyticus]SNZ19200.1 Predicted ATPase, AAA+ ATPase superfamily [Cohaesibacter gelatinilyticus]